MPSTATSILDGLSTSVAVKAPCRTVATSNITLTGLQTISGYTTVEGDRVLVKGQTNSVDNGIYTASTGSWTRAKDADGNRDLVQGTRVIIRSTTADGVEYELTTANPIVIGTTAQTWTLRYGANATYDQTEEEIAASVTPTDTSERYLDVDRYASIQQALNVLLDAGGELEFSKGRTYAVGNTNLTLLRTGSGDAKRMVIDGHGAILTFTGLASGSALKIGADSQANFVEGGELVIRNLTLQGPETGSPLTDNPSTSCVGLELVFAGSVLLENVKCPGFHTAFRSKFAFPVTTVNCSGRTSWVGWWHDEASNQIEHINFEAPNCRYSFVHKSDSTALDSGKQNQVAYRKPWIEGSRVGWSIDSGSGGIGAVRFRNISIIEPYVSTVTYDVIRIGTVLTFSTPETRGANCSEFINDFRVVDGLWNPTGGLWSATSAAICYDSVQRVRHAMIDIPVVSKESDSDVFVNGPGGGVVRTKAYPGVSDAIITEYLYDSNGSIVRRFQPNGNAIFGSTKSTGGSITEAGAEVKNTGQIDAVGDAIAAIRAGRNTSVGTIQAFYQAGALAGSVDTMSSDRIKLNLNGAGTVFLMIGSGSPEGSVTGSVGSLYLRTDGGAGTSQYTKESGSGNTGWVAK